MSIRMGILLSMIMGAGAWAQPVNYEPNWSSLRQHHTPQWMDGMKFGIYCHWGPQMIQQARGDKDMDRVEALNYWTGEKFSAAAWVDLFQAAGAQFAGPVAWHGSGLLNWDSKITDWNTAKRGPKIDIVGQLTRELHRRNMKVVTTFHNNYSIWGRISKTNPAVLGTDDDSPLYTANAGRRDEALLQGWYDRVTEAIDTYRPDIVWVDTSFGGTVGAELRGRSLAGRMLPEKDNALNTLSEAIQQKLLAHYFNKGVEWGEGVEFVYKSFDIPPGIGMRDIENGSLIGLQYDPWMADINMAINVDPQTAWFYNPKNPMKDANSLVDLLVDLTSKNGRMLLNVPPKPDGSFSADQIRQLTAVGDWLKINGEAIYDTIPWSFFGEGPTEETHPGHHNHGLWTEKNKFVPKWTKDDIRFTQKGKNLYAIVLDWPGTELAIHTLGSAGKLYHGDIKSIRLLGSDAPIKWTQSAEALVVQFPKKRPCNFAYVLKVERK